jgi:hypothetical protein
MKLYLLGITLLLSFVTTSYSHADALDKKGKMFFYYGYNRSEYSNGDYHITGNGHDFILRDVKATDVQTPIGADPYLNPFAWSVPQNTMRLGYYLTDNLSISLGNDHMKYDMTQNQTVNIEGTVAGSPSTYYAPGSTKKLTDDFLQFEHTDGLNYVSLELEHYIPLWVSSNKRNAMSFFWGPGLAVMYPKTNATFLNNKRNDEFHIAGSGYSIKTGLEFIFLDDWFTRLVTKFGSINMNDAYLTDTHVERLAHKFTFSELYLVVGLNF